MVRLVSEYGGVIVLIEAYCKGSEKWKKDRALAGNPVYEAEEDWPVTIFITQQSIDFISARILAKDEDFVIWLWKFPDQQKQFKIELKDIDYILELDNLADFTNEIALSLIPKNFDPVKIQSLATAVRAIGEKLTDVFM